MEDWVFFEKFYNYGPIRIGFIWSDPEALDEIYEVHLVTIGDQVARDVDDVHPNVARAVLKELTTNHSDKHMLDLTPVTGVIWADALAQTAPVWRTGG